MSACHASPRRVLLLLPLAVGVSLSACGGEDEAPEPQGEGPAQGAALDADAFADALAAPGTVVLDVRTPPEFTGGHLEGAVNLDVSDPGFESGLEGLDRQVPYAVYCRSGNRSQVAVDLMVAKGFSSTYHLEGGIGAWVGAGHPITT